MVAEVGVTRTLSQEEVDKMHEEHQKSLFEGRGPFSGTRVCVCGGDVKYNVDRSDGAKLGACQECHALYIDHRIRRRH